MRFDKPPTTFEEQVGLLRARGMVIDNSKRAQQYLSHLNYYRLAAYWMPFTLGSDSRRFKPGASFDTVLQHYVFDRELRLLIMDAVERLEVSLRTQWAYYLAHHYGPHAHLDSQVFKSPSKRWSHERNVQKLKDAARSGPEDLLFDFRGFDEALPPLWAVCEMMTLGQLSKWYANLRHRKDRNAIVRVYDLDASVMASFLHHLSIVRNHCAHHARLWNREITIAWKFPKRATATLRESLDTMSASQKKLYNTLTLLAYLLDQIGSHHWKQRLGKLLAKYPAVPPHAMGFPDDWKKRPLWYGQVG